MTSDLLEHRLKDDFFNKTDDFQNEGWDGD